MKPYYLTIWSNEKHSATASEQYLRLSAKEAFETGLEQCDGHDGSFSIVFFDTAKGVSDDVTQKAFQDHCNEILDQMTPFTVVEMQDGKICFGDEQDGDAPYVDPNASNYLLAEQLGVGGLR